MNASESEEDDALNVQGVSLEDILDEASDDDGDLFDDPDPSRDNPPHLSRYTEYTM